MKDSQRKAMFAGKKNFKVSVPYKKEDLLRIGGVWNDATIDQRKKIIINTHNGFTDGHYPNLGKRYFDLDHHVQSTIAHHWNDVNNPFDKNKASFFGVTPS